MWSNDRRRTMCYAYKMGSISRSRIWIFEDNTKFWRRGTDDCSPDEILSASERMFTMTVESQASAETVLVTGEVNSYRMQNFPPSNIIIIIIVVCYIRTLNYILGE